MNLEQSIIDGAQINEAIGKEVVEVTKAFRLDCRKNDLPLATKSVHLVKLLGVEISMTLVWQRPEL